MVDWSFYIVRILRNWENLWENNNLAVMLKALENEFYFKELKRKKIFDWWDISVLFFQWCSLINEIKGILYVFWFRVVREYLVLKIDEDNVF